MRTRTRGRRSRDRRQAVIQENTEARAKRSPLAQLAKLDREGHTAAKERARLQRVIDKTY
jgi:hypothetical protein